ncbi:hypothetical protein BN59_01093 [Legionella massiliensis]|uniref:Uncharacterized protein n=1 Tax=Legionella massiliensis TaxID=1034943 RepID=A0A078KUZ5_9GAMM|nr:hypothetical protein [Legionella massiliensis]CDZ76817.1 hypothetical protein BN59_01093 [Legionella massiliensis]CEE12555.1 hypothetical protein BN1094_01093 [Legionella massiliensis]
MTLSEHEKEIIRLVDEQVKQLVEKNASDILIVQTLADFIPELRCLLSSTSEKQLDLYCREYLHFNRFLQLITHSH